MHGKCPSFPSYNCKKLKYSNRTSIRIQQSEKHLVDNYIKCAEMILKFRFRVSNSQNSQQSEKC